MPKAGFIVARFSFLVLAASMLGVAMLAAPAAGQPPSCASSSGKCFAVTVSPSSAAAGASASFAFTITNEATTQQLGSAQISAPAGFAITGAPGAASVTSSSATFLNLPLTTQGSMTTLTVNATVSCNRSTSTYQWGIEAKQSNDFNGTGNDFQLDPNSAGNLSGTLTGCTFQPCPPDAQCSASASSPSTSTAPTSGTVTTTSPLPPGDTLVTGMESGSVGSPFDFSCGTTPPVYTPLSDVFNFAVFTASGLPQKGITLKVVLRIDKSVVNASNHPGASSWQICYASTEFFNALAGTSQTGVTIGGSSGYTTGLLPDCTSTPAAPCVQARNKNNAGDVIVTFLALGDPFAHG